MSVSQSGHQKQQKQEKQDNERKYMNELALFAGIGGGILAGTLHGWNTVCGVEINPFCVGRLLQRQNEGHLPPFPIWDDVCTFDGRPWKGIVDVVSGGFPCQPFSNATHGNPTAIDLWPEMLRIIKEVVPKFVFAENVKLSPIAKAADDCESLGYKTKIIALSAEDLGADHTRQRYWLLAYSDMHGELHRPQHDETQMLPTFCPSVWENKESVGCGVVDGLSKGMDRLRAAGNGQVPAVAAAAWEILTEGIL
jgi:DNA (cytosine-5)-methyltransferase 1